MIKKIHFLCFFIVIFRHRLHHSIPLPLITTSLHTYIKLVIFSSEIFSINNLYDKTTFVGSASLIIKINIKSNLIRNSRYSYFFFFFYS
jgi:hypothetical protein